jgi:CMP/dCMP kinase
VVVVAIDGPAGVGKSTVAREVARMTGFLYINSGSFYRAITLAVLDRGVPTGDADSVLSAAQGRSLEMKRGNLYLDGGDVESRLHGSDVDAWVAPLSSIPGVRDIVNRHLRAVAARSDVVVEGRDIGTVVFPDAAVKVFLDADVATRAARRHSQGVSDLSRDQIETAIRERDRVDRTKPVGRLVAAPDALIIDTSHLTIQQVCERVRSAILVSRNNPGEIRRL